MTKNERNFLRELACTVEASSTKNDEKSFLRELADVMEASSITIGRIVDEKSDEEEDDDFNADMADIIGE